MQERAESIGATLQITSEIGQGTTISLQHVNPPQSA
jgi:signal transduction histidine kinase